ncbi:MAG: hypothetical protein FWF45_05055 [Coriobacteriia bacterium]|nr:hypothetical protein [Coriobacteriia bacterium]
MSFEQQFTQIQPEDLTDNVFRLVGKDFFAITAGAPEAHAYIEETYQDPDEQRKYVFGEITALWVKR